MFRRHDALKQALIGAAVRSRPIGRRLLPSERRSSKITMKGEDGVLGACCANESTAPVPKGGGANGADGACRPRSKVWLPRHRWSCISG